MNQNFEDLVEDYLSENLPLDIKKEFEERMRQDPAFAARVDLERALAETLRSDNPEIALRQNLQRIADSVSDSDIPASGSGMNWIKWGGIGLLLLALALPFSLPIFRHSLNKEEAPALLQQPTPAPQAAPGPPTQESPAKPANTSPATPEPIAAAYRPLPPLEAYIGTRHRSASTEVQVQKPQNKAVFNARSGKIQFECAGVLNTVDKEEDTHYNTLIFNNNLASWQAYKPISKHSIQADNTGKFKWSASLPLPPGLYYLVIEDENTGDILTVNSFTVKAE